VAAAPNVELGKTVAAIVGGLQHCCELDINLLTAHVVASDIGRDPRGLAA
jgi:hypothetical protein